MEANAALIFVSFILSLVGKLGVSLGPLPRALKTYCTYGRWISNRRKYPRAAPPDPRKNTQIPLTLYLLFSKREGVLEILYILAGGTGGGAAAPLFYRFFMSSLCIMSSPFSFFLIFIRLDFHLR